MTKVKNPLPKPELCDNCCSSNVEYTTNDKIYGRKYGNWPYLYLCNDCGASVGCHPETEIPLGKMATKEIKTLRAEAHKHFDPLWRNGAMTRSKAYIWLADNLKIDVNECHISWLSKEKLIESIEVCKNYLANYSENLEKRKVKQNAKQRRQEKRNKRFTAAKIRERKARR